MAPEHAALASRTLQIREEVWAATLAEYRLLLASDELARAPGSKIAGFGLSRDAQRRLAAFARAYLRHSPHEADAPVDAPPVSCPACSELAVRPSHARRASQGAAAAPGRDSALLYGRCSRCGHGTLLAPAPESTHASRLYTEASYYERRDSQGTGYDAYGAEAAYREAKGAVLMARLSSATGRKVERLLEVGSGFGFTRIAAERAGARTTGVDRNPHAAREAERRYSLATFVGTLDAALAEPRSGIDAESADLVLYHFVLEHIADVAAELAVARRAVRPGGFLVLVVPSMEAAEIAVFSAAYRSFRADHQHLFTRASLARWLEPAGFGVQLLESGCNLHLLAPCLSEAELASLYAGGFGPDFLVVARRIA